MFRNHKIHLNDDICENPKIVNIEILYHHTIILKYPKFQILLKVIDFLHGADI